MILPVTHSPNVINDYVYADASARTSAVLLIGDIGKVAWQKHDDTFWQLTNSPSTWTQISGPKGGTIASLSSLNGLAKDISIVGVNGLVASTSGNNVQIGLGGSSINYALSASSGAYTTSTTGQTEVLSTGSFTTKGGPIQVILVSDGGPNESLIGFVAPSSALGYVRIYRDDTVLISAQQIGSSSTAIYIPPSSISILDFGAVAGSHYYTIYVWNSAGGSTAYVSYVKALAYEL